MAKQPWICCGECSEALADVWEAIDELRRQLAERVRETEREDVETTDGVQETEE